MPVVTWDGARGVGERNARRAAPMRPASRVRVPGTTRTRRTKPRAARRQGFEEDRPGGGDAAADHDEVEVGQGGGADDAAGECVGAAVERGKGDRQAGVRVGGECARVRARPAPFPRPADQAAYPLSRYQLRFRKPFLYTILFATGLPITAVMVPVYSLYARYNLTDSIPATILFMTASSLPFGIWMTKNFMDGVPISLEEAAWTDGANWFQSLCRIVLPLMAPGLIVVFIFTFVLEWGNFFVPFILLLSPDKQPASVTIYTFFSQYGEVAYGQLAAFSILYAAPVILLYGALSKFLGGAFSLTGAVKG
jgi:ABC-type molybdate transport system permease subunit